MNFNSLNTTWKKPVTKDHMRRDFICVTFQEWQNRMLEAQKWLPEPGVGTGGDWVQKGTKELLGIMEMSYIVMWWLHNCQNPWTLYAFSWWVLLHVNDASIKLILKIELECCWNGTLSLLISSATSCEPPSKQPKYLLKTLIRLHLSLFKHAHGFSFLFEWHPEDYCGLQVPLPRLLTPTLARTGAIIQMEACVHV